MKLVKERIFSLVISFVMIISLIPITHAANNNYTYSVNGGNLTFNPTTGQITKCDSSVYEANIPEEIYGVPVTDIAYNAFGYRASKLIRVTIPSSITEIGKGPFYQSYIQEVTIPSSVTSIGEIAFGNSKLNSVTIPDSVKTIGERAFSNCKNLKTVVLSSQLTKLDRWTFSGCSALEDISLPDSLEEIGYEVFANCKSLSSLTIGPNVTYIDDKAFSSCNSLKKIYFQGDAPMIGKNIFGYSGIDGLIIYYPEGASGWSSPTWNGIITKSYKLNDSSTSTTPSNPDPVTPAQPQNLTTNGQRVDPWALNLVNEAIASNLMPNSLGNDLRANITREQFAGVAVKLYEAMSGSTIPTPALASNNFTDTSNADVRKAYLMGFVSGTSATTFGPNSPLNREQAAVMLSNVYKALGGVITARNPGAFSDDKEISSWAKNAVYFMSENGIISGVGNNNFSPQGKTQSQAAIVLALRMYQNLK